MSGLERALDDIAVQIGAEVRRRNRVGEDGERGVISASCEMAATTLVLAALADTHSALRAYLTAVSPKAGAVEVKALEKAWTNFCDANPDDLTSPEDLPDHALMTCAQFVDYASSALIPTPSVAEAAEPDPMSVEEHRLETLKQMATYAGPIVSLEVGASYYLASCDDCGWVGSSELCGTDHFGDDSDVYCPRCHASGADCGKVAAALVCHPAPSAPIPDGLEARHAKWEREAREARHDTIHRIVWGFASLDEAGRLAAIAAFNELHNYTRNTVRYAMERKS